MLYPTHWEPPPTSTPAMPTSSVASLSSFSSASSTSSRSPEAVYAFAAINATTVLRCRQRLSSHHHFPELEEFIRFIIDNTDITPTSLVVALIYLERLRLSLPREAHGDFDTPYRLFLAAIIVASKYTSDYGYLRNSVVSNLVARLGLFDAADINTFERCFLGLLNYDLSIQKKDIHSFIDRFGDQLDIVLQSEDRLVYIDGL
ncbi:hypothetical protein BZG36_01398 [Bifiguratus adelaidae]|uniref:Cyclin N-terminal domain-containing protein n=1 Tax=Bifiguratus adelaidae TaxID=1938954 RepID=A0A261Y3D7_9FUNG|nr:hypothetical protein BZG36_01398 [Bifiguratus adelaidae]